MTPYRRDDAQRQLVGGLFIMALGVLFLFDQFAIFSFGRAVSLLWPLALIWMGVSKLMRRTETRPMDGDRQDAR